MLNANVLKRMKEVEEAILDLDESVRAPAFAMMQDYILGEAVRQPGTRVGRDAASTGGNDEPDGAMEAFFAKLDLDKPADAVYAITGFLYSQYGAAAFTVQDVQEIADQVGLTVPSRVDMTLRQARRKGKSLFRAAGKGNWAPTVLGEKTLKNELGVTKGRKKHPIEDEVT